MSKKKRVTLTPKGNARDGKQEAKVYPGTYKKRGVEYPCYFVRGWKENGKWQRKQFSDESKAKLEAESINLNLKNTGTKRGLVLTTLNESQLIQAEDAFSILGDTYTLRETVKFFLKHNRAPDYSITLLDGYKHYIDYKERDGVRQATINSTKKVLKAFAKHADNPLVHTVTEDQVISYLESLRGIDRVSPCKKKTWNNNRTEIHSFYLWAQKKHLKTNRPWTFNNPVDGVHRHKEKRIREERPAIATTSPEAVKDLLTYAMNYKGGILVKWFALAYFAGLRPSSEKNEPGELMKLSDREDELINLATGRILIPANVAKTKHHRPVVMSENLKLWLEAYKDLPIAPENIKGDNTHVRHMFNLQQDETRHSFISYHVALHRSIGDAAIEAGNTEAIVKAHYLDHQPKELGAAFFSIVPDMKNKCAVFSS